MRANVKMNITDETDVDLNSTTSCILLQVNGSFLCDPQLNNAQCKPIDYDGDDFEPQHRNCTGEEFLKIAFGPKRVRDKFSINFFLMLGP